MGIEMPKITDELKDKMNSLRQSMTLADISNMLGVSVSSVWKYTKNKKIKSKNLKLIDIEALKEMRKTHTLYDVAEYFGVSVSFVHRNTRGVKHERRLPSKSPLYGLWLGIKSRCDNPTDGRYRYYGARGINLHPAWYCFDVFEREVLAEIGYKPIRKENSLSLDRIDNNAGYKPGNIRWADFKTQCDNRRSITKYLLTVDGSQMTVKQAAEYLGLSTKAIYRRLSKGIPITKSKT
jgi:predicted DNA-binding transcriptional regulator AlpA